MSRYRYPWSLVKCLRCRVPGQLWMTRGLSTHSKTSTGQPSLEEHYDVVISGGGVIGCSSAYFLARRMPGRSVCIIERDPKVRKLCHLVLMELLNQLDCITWPK